MTCPFVYVISTHCVMREKGEWVRLLHEKRKGGRRILIQALTPGWALSTKLVIKVCCSSNIIIRILNDLPIWVSHFYSLRDERKGRERVRVLTPGWALSTKLVIKVRASSDIIIRAHLSGFNRKARCVKSWIKSIRSSGITGFSFSPGILIGISYLVEYSFWTESKSVYSDKLFWKTFVYIKGVTTFLGSSLKKLSARPRKKTNSMSWKVEWKKKISHLPLQFHVFI